MSTRWTERDLQVISEAAFDGAERASEALREHFGPRGAGVLALACQAADDLVAGRTVEAGGGVVLTRDVGDALTGRVLEADDGEALMRDAPDAPTGRVVRRVLG